MDDQDTADRLTVRCVCGWQVTGMEGEVVAATAEHGERLHNMKATPEQILAMAVRSDPESPAPAPADVPS